MNPIPAAPLALFTRSDGLRLAYRYRAGRGPTILFLPGYMSDMEGSKAVAIDAWAAETGRAVLRFDYGGNGASEGRFEDGTLVSWRDDALSLIDALTDGPLLLVGSSMGGWIALLIALARPERIAGLVGIAAAPDFTDWGFSDADKALLATEGQLREPTPYGDQPLVTTLTFWQSGQALRLLGATIPINCPVRLLQGQEDRDVPWQTALRLSQRLHSYDVQTLLIKDGDHRLSRDSDIELLIHTLGRLVDIL